MWFSRLFRACLNFPNLVDSESFLYQTSAENRSLAGQVTVFATKYGVKRAGIRPMMDF